MEEEGLVATGSSEVVTVTQLASWKEYVRRVNYEQRKSMESFAIRYSFWHL